MPSLVNVYRSYASQLDDAEQFEWIYKNIVRLLQLSMKSRSFLGSSLKVSYTHELMVLLWQMMQLNSAFTTYIAEECEILQLLDVLTVFVTEAKEDESKLNMCQLCLFMLLSLSSIREFNVQLAQPYRGHLNVIYLSLETYFDLQVVFLHGLATSKGSLATQTGCLLAILHNMAMYAKTIDSVASSKLVHLLECVSSPSLLFSEGVYGSYLQICVDIINTRLQYHWDVTLTQGSIQLIYALLRQRGLYDRLLALSPPSEEPWQTEEWANTWLPMLKASPLMIMYRDLYPRIDKLSATGLITTEELLWLLQRTTMVGLFPRPHKITLHTFIPMEETKQWFTMLTWSLVLAQQQQLVAVSAVRLFETLERPLES
jgi:hypothetical protein